ncbi:hypothetical protein FJT64_027020 [Amphibalanus amphitrite]|uniref:Uncharacterized protein n=1 Tax=Amphibalanus amphitrite TaxID=1232801 RepID=A0A6A4W9Q0_AMPAM|nr:hypothetical protein FJT64_027020 [Amphibalanus amphitrite]
MVHRAAAEYRELLPPPEPDQSADCVPPGSRGRRLLVLRQSRPASLADKVQDDRPAARQTVLPPASMPQALRVIHELRVQNLHLQAALLRAGIEPLRPAPETQAEPGQLPRLRPGRGSHKELAMVAATRLRHLERLEAGMERVFSTAQIGIICGEDNRAVKKWSEKDLWRAIELRTMCSRKVFDYVRRLARWKPIEPPAPRFVGPTAHWSTVNAEDQSAASDGDDQSDGEDSDERYAKYRDRVVQEPLWM